MKKLLIIPLTFALILILPLTAWAKVGVVIDSKEYGFYPPPIIQNDCTLIPMRSFFEALGANVNWEPETQTVVGTRGGVTVRFPIGSTSPTINGRVETIKVASQIINGMTYIPLRFAAESLGDDVKWVDAVQTIFITRKGIKLPPYIPLEIPPINQEDWRLSVPLWIIGPTKDRIQDVHKKLTQSIPQTRDGSHGIGLWGGSLSYVYSRMEKKYYLAEIKDSNSLIFFNPRHDTMEALRSWPEDYKFMLPLSFTEIEYESKNLPFMFFSKCEYNFIRGIIVTSDNNQLTIAERYLINNEIPLNKVIRFKDARGTGLLTPFSADNGL